MSTKRRPFRITCGCSLDIPVQPMWPRLRFGFPEGPKETVNKAAALAKAIDLAEKAFL